MKGAFKRWTPGWGKRSWRKWLAKTKRGAVQRAAIRDQLCDEHDWFRAGSYTDEFGLGHVRRDCRRCPVREWNYALGG